MSKTLRITPSTLRGQSQQLTNLYAQLSQLETKTKTALDLLDNATSAKFSLAMMTKTAILTVKIKALKEILDQGAKIAAKCAESYENADKVIRDTIGDSLPDHVEDSPVSQQEVSSPGDEYRDKIAGLLEAEKANLAAGTPQKYWSWYYGKQSNRGDSWCTVFTSYMMAQAGIDVDTPTGESTWFKTGANYQYSYFKNHGFVEQKSAGYTPQVGDLVFYESSPGKCGHVAIVTSVTNGQIMTLHGNIGRPTIGEIKEGSYINGSGYCKILGYGNVAALAEYQNQ